MKKILLFAAFAAALTLSSCKKEVNDVEPVAAIRTVSFSALPTETKTVFGSKNGNKYPVIWQAGDKVCPSFNFADPSSDNYLSVTPSADGSSASFDGQVPEAQSYQFIFVCPAVAFKSINKTNKTVMVEFPSGQTSTAASPDPAAMILYANTGELASIPSPVALEFDHLSAYLHLQFDHVNLGTATVQAVNVTSEDNTLAGRIFYKIETGAFEPNTNFHTIAVATTTLEDVWCGVCPGDFSGKQLKIEVSTDQGTLTKTLTMPASANLTCGKIAKFTVDMSSIPIVAPVVYKAISATNPLNVGDKVIIAAAGVDQPYAVSTGQNGNNRSAAGVTKTAVEIVNPIESVEIFEIEDGIIPGHFAFHTTNTDGVKDPENDGYIYAGNQGNSGSNILKTKATKDNSASWAVSVEDVTVGSTTWQNATRIFADIPSNGRGLLRFNSSDKLFSAYGNGTSQEAVKIYRLDVPADNTPRFNVTLPNGNTVSSSAQTVPVYVFGNVAWEASVTTGASLDAASGTGPAILTLSIPENTDDRFKSYTVTVSTAASVSPQSYSFTIKQEEPLVVGTVLFHEYWQGGQADDKVATYLARPEHSTRVFGGADLVYSSDSKSKLYNTGTVYLGSGHTIDELPESAKMNIRIQDRGGYWNIKGVPCKGVKKAKIVFRINRSGSYYTATSTTSGVTIGTRQEEGKTSTWNKTYYEVTYPVEFSSSLTTFEFQINDKYTNSDTSVTRHIYLTDAEVIVTELY